MHAMAIGAAALVLFVTLSPSSAQDLEVAMVAPASLTPELMATRSATAPLPEIKLTPELLANYVARQQALKSFSGFDVAPKGELTAELLSSYIARKRNPALEAIDAAEADQASALNGVMLASYATAKFVPTEKKVHLADSERLCLSQAIYHEARGESDEGQWAVANIIINRAMSKKYPSTICGVVFQNAKKGGGGCQFSFACDGRSDVARERAAWNKANRIAVAAFQEFQRGESPDILPKSALFYHTQAVSPSWSRSFKRVATIGSHIFYAPL
jgi:spore germination cell wall hydrolase CwlJ-like protein